MAAYAIVGRAVLDRIRDEAPEHIKATFARVVEVLSHGPYPGNHFLHALEAKGIAPNHYTAAAEGLLLLYEVRETAPVKIVVLVDAIWT